MKNDEKIMANVRTFLAETYTKSNYSWPGTAENPMKPVFCKHPLTGEEIQVHYNDRNLITDRDYKEAGFEYVDGKGWCWPINI